MTSTREPYQQSWMPEPGQQHQGVPHAAGFSGPPWYGGPPPAGLHGPMAAAPRHRAGWIALGAVGLLLAIVMVSAYAAAHRTMTVDGDVTLNVRWSSLSPGVGCEGRNGYSFLQPGAPVSIYNASGDLVGSTTLGAGITSYQGNGWSSSYADTCTFHFTLTDVPTGDDYYRVAVGSGTAAGVPFTRTELETSGASLSYGN
ncbi:hypothetical protein [Pseudonocardia phyllosphaerae]|uniref:hypothetical protein n=1 Tax=Pseudonocardia phyllosphaerae TaxID=3390502 RepID=UPI0039799452